MPGLTTMQFHYCLRCNSWVICASIVDSVRFWYNIKRIQAWHVLPPYVQMHKDKIWESTRSNRIKVAISSLSIYIDVCWNCNERKRCLMLVVRVNAFALSLCINTCRRNQIREDQHDIRYKPATTPSHSPSPTTGGGAEGGSGLIFAFFLFGRRILFEGVASFCFSFARASSSLSLSAAPPLFGCAGNDRSFTNKHFFVASQASRQFTATEA